jgi:hypothetical protein
MNMMRKTKCRFGKLFVLLIGWLASGCTTIAPRIADDRSVSTTQTFSHERFDRVLQTYVDGQGMVNYSDLQKAPEDLEAYYQLITLYSPDSDPELFPSQQHQLAYWLNAYNAGVIKTVLTYYPIDSVLAVKNPALFFFLTDKAGFFFFQRLTFGGKTTSLYYLENQVIRKRFADPRIHFALNCASLGCPRLPRQSFSGDHLDNQLDRETRLFLSEKRNFEIDYRQRTIYLSAIFQWYQQDYIDWYQKMYPRNAASLLSYISLYLSADQAAQLNQVGDTFSIEFRPYDWRLNDQKNHP